MMKRFIALLCCITIFCSVAWADQEIIVKLDRQNKETQTVELGYATVTFQLISAYDNKAGVKVAVENITQSQTILLFKITQDEKMLKKRKPKIVFEKTYGGEKGHRFASGCKYVKKTYEQILPAYTQELFILETSTTNSTELVLPFYLAKYNPKKFFSLDKYSILQEDVIKFILEVKDWSESDPTYIDVQKSIVDFKSQLIPKMFCNNKKHTPSLERQQQPYQVTKDSIISVIDSILVANTSWMSQDLPHKSYTKLREEIEAIDLNNYTYDCKKHFTLHRCNYCSLNAEQIYHRLDDTYQQLHTGKIAKENAVKTAKVLNNCYQQNKRRKRNNFYGEKISDYYNRILNF